MEFKGRRGAAKGGQGDRGMADGLELGGVSRGGRGTQGCPWRGRVHCSLLEGAELRAVGWLPGGRKGGIWEAQPLSLVTRDTEENVGVDRAVP